MEQEDSNDSNSNSNDVALCGAIVADDEDRFSEALDEFPFYDCTDFGEIDSVSESNLVRGSESESDPDLLKPKLRRRRTVSRYSQSDVSESGDDSSGSSLFADARLADSAKKFRSLRNFNANKDDTDKLSLRNDTEEIRESSVVTDDNNVMPSVSNNERNVNNERSDELNRVGVEDTSSSVLFKLASFMISAIGYQLRLIYRLVTFPVWLVYSVYMFVVDPFRISRRLKEFVIKRLLKLVGRIYGRVSPVIYEWFKERNYVWKLGFRFGWGMLCSFYVCVVLVGTFVSAFVISGLLVSSLVEEPVYIKDTLNFDYTKPSPVALLPLMSCPDDSCGTNCGEKIEIGKLGGSRVIPSKHKMQVTVSLTLPESDYNKNLGIFQVRVDLLSADGVALSSSRQHSMLHFRSEPVRLLLTFLKIAPLLAGLYSETQVLNIRFRGFTEKDTPTSCIKVIVEQRAEFKSRAGIPEVYDASLSLESELPLLRRIMWYWKKTIFIWLSMTVFTTELLLALLCCSPLILPWKTRRGSNSNIGAPQNASPVQM
ncbi:putative adipose-regulatory protein (Seipin) [Heracleum sosnowskyi]|uniref:Adipose-regulatory protein (Seipin) n=1 Tax=Heracleum sosnowskyi TaxID=360622 RepID=A0AAD8HLH6_9APIA|nr:putative adipose-regulatory protein (Seipin) [Heracleum sosnowskyi]